MRFLFILLLLSGSTALMGGLLMLHDLFKTTNQSSQEKHSKVVERKITDAENLFDSSSEPYQNISSKEDDSSLT